MRMEPYNKANVPNYRELQEYDWVEDFLLCQDLHTEIERLVELRREILNTHSSKEAFKNRLKKSFEAFRVRRRNSLQRFLLRVERSNDPFRRFEYLEDPAVHRGIVPLSWNDIEDALANIQELESGFSDTDRAEKLADVDDEVARAKKELAKLNKPKFFPLAGGGIECDIRHIFFKWWLEVQYQCNRPCGPQGFVLDSSPANEIEAYHRLGIHRAIKTTEPRTNSPAER